MTFRLLLDEHVEYELVRRLSEGGHDVEHLEDRPDIGKGTSDEEIAAYAAATERIVLTYDADFLLEIEESSHGGVIYFADESLSPADVAAIVEALSTYYPPDEIDGVLYAGTEWL